MFVMQSLLWRWQNYMPDKREYIVYHIVHTSFTYFILYIHLLYSQIPIYCVDFIMSIIEIQEIVVKC